MLSLDLIETIENGIQILKFNRPNKKNALNPYIYQTTVKLLKKASEDDDILLTVITGNGDYFSSGNDFQKTAEVVNSTKKEDVSQLFINYREFVNALIDYPKLLIALVNGPAIGVAFTTLPLYDLVYCSENAFFLAPFTKLGITAEGCSTYTFPLIFGKSKASEILLLNYKLSAKEALRYGLVSEVLTDKELHEDVWKKINSYAHLNQDSIRQSKKNIVDKILLKNVNMTEYKTLLNLYTKIFDKFSIKSSL